MSAEHRYSEQEIAAIFKQAAEAQEAAQQQKSPGEGLTLAELQQIGQETGITPEFIARAAAAVDRTGPSLPPTTYFGIPISVARTVDLPGPLSDDGWDQLVVDLRETFQAYGEIRRDGVHRQWKNGNLQALIEPTESGHRLRLRTLHGNARSALLGGLTFFAMALAFTLVVAVSGKLGLNPETLVMAMLGAAGLGSIGLAAFQLPRWAEERGRQMEAIAARTVERMTPEPPSPLRDSISSPRLDLDTLPDRADATPERRPGQSHA